MSNQNSQINLKHFKPEEFRGWFDRMNPALLHQLDEFREQLGAPVIISPAHGAIGRHQGETGKSQHNIDRYGEVRAIDVMPQTDDMRHAFNVAMRVGFHGIGVYPDWRPHWGLHLDMRKDRPPQNPALWSGLMVAGKQKYFGIELAWKREGTA